MKAAICAIIVLAILAGTAFAVRPADRVLAEKKLDGRVCMVIWRYSRLSISREAGELVFASVLGEKRQEVRSGFIGDWSGNSVIAWTQISDAELRAVDSYSGIRAVFKKDGVIEVGR
jgi:hypothetical protein